MKIISNFNLIRFVLNLLFLRGVKSLFRNTLLFLFVCFVSLQSFSQYNASANANGLLGSDITVKNEQGAVSNEKRNSYSRPANIPLKKITQINCDSNFFWGIDSAGHIVQLSIKDTNVVVDGIVDSTAAGWGLAVCNNLNGGTMNPAFYISSSKSPYNNVLYSNENGSWVTVPQTAPEPLYNGAGYGNNVYFTGTSADTIVKYDGKNFSAIPLNDGLMFAVAGLTVDSSGNIWCFRGEFVGFYLSEFIDVISPSGKLLRQYSYAFLAGNAYGCFMRHNTLYIGLGPYAMSFPNKLIAITFSADTIFSSTLISMPRDNWYDLASCNISPTCNVVSLNQNPVSTTVCGTGSANFSVTATGDETISYQWQVNNGSWSNITAAGNNPTYSGYTASKLNSNKSNCDFAVSLYSIKLLSCKICYKQCSNFNFY